MGGAGSREGALSHVNVISRRKSRKLFQWWCPNLGFCFRHLAFIGCTSEDGEFLFFLFRDKASYIPGWPWHVAEDVLELMTLELVIAFWLCYTLPPVTPSGAPDLGFSISVLCVLFYIPDWPQSWCLSDPSIPWSFLISPTDNSCLAPGPAGLGISKVAIKLTFLAGL